MKKFLSLFFIASLSISVLYGNGNEGSNNSSEPEKQVIELDKTKIKWNSERTISVSYIEAWLCPEFSRLEFLLENIGEADIHIINENGLTITSIENISTEVPTFIHLPLQSFSGAYTILIVSETWIAEGCFVI